MQKQKTKKSASKRFKVTSSGKIMRRRSFTGHLNVKRSKRQKRRLKNAVEVQGKYAKKLKKVLGVRSRRKLVLTTERRKDAKN
jgi:large subunit ribosomal protein L35